MGERKHISLLDLQSMIRERIEDALPLSYWVTAEISELKVNYSGHCYLELVEKGGANQVPRARAGAVIWRGTFGAINSFFVSSTGSELAAGMRVLIKVSVSYHELYGLSLVISDIDPTYTVGDMERQRQEAISRLREEGVFDMNRSLDMPVAAQRVAVVSSRNAAGYQDFMNEIEASCYHFDIVLFDAFMQGAGTEDSVIGALEAIAENIERFDAVVVIRGGGAQSDLAAFDSYRLSSHIAQFPLPVITGIGHDKDQSVADLVAAVSLKTPTAVAAWLVEGLAEFDRWLDQATGELLELSVGFFDDRRRRLQRAALSLSGISAALTRKLDLKLERLAGELVRRRGEAIAGRSGRLDILEALLAERAAGSIGRERTRLDTASVMVGSRHPSRILSLGFAIVRSGGVAVKSSSSLRTDDVLEITLSEGSVEAKVK